MSDAPSTPPAPDAAAVALPQPSGTTDTGLAALCLVARFHQVAADADTLRHRLALGSMAEASTEDLQRAAHAIGLTARPHRSTPDRLAQAPLPALARLADGRWVVLAQCDGERVLLQQFDAEAGGAARPTIEPLAGFAARWTGEMLLVAHAGALAAARERFDLAWFVPSLVRHRRLLLEVLLVSIVLQGFGLVTPLFFQVVMDKVLVHQGRSTLDVLAIGLVAVMVFESVLGVLRSQVFSHTTSRIDVELGSRLYRHLLNLPLAYFQARRVGDTVARVRELEHIRQFLTGQALMLVLDLLFSVVFIAAMLSYSMTLGLIVLASVPVYVLLSVMVVPVLRRRLDEKFARGAEVQAMLVESVTGVQTLKAHALEPAFAQRWDRQLAAYVSAGFRSQQLATVAHEAVGLTGKLVQAATLWFGAQAVMEQQLTVGMFVAFNLFAQRVAQPVMRIAQMWTDFQQTGLSMRRLADILDTHGEAGTGGASATAALPRLRGQLRFDQVTFRYRPDAAPVLQGLTLDVRAGEVIGIVGRSGSGKSTLAKLLQRLHVPEQGRVLVDGLDLALLDPAQLRRQIGVVLQDNFLFHRSVRENIAIADPAAPLEAVMQAARLAGAHEFISELPEGYDTVVGEQGASLSGGQRQRIAIARALFTNPRVLIFDEATSALDYESEAIVQRHMAQICRGRTVIVIAHRLSAVRQADRIVAMDRGRVVEVGPHDELLRRNGLYAYLWRLQNLAPGAGPAAVGQEVRA